MIYLVLALFLIVGCLDALQDLSSEGRFKIDWFNKSKSWLRKWKDPLDIETKEYWYYLWIYVPKYKESFMWSSTVLVWLTDFWHLAKTIKNVCIKVAVIICYHFTDIQEISFIQMFIEYLVLYVCSSIGFNTIYEYGKRKH